jgi:hypothetical protein
MLEGVTGLCDLAANAALRAAPTRGGNARRGGHVTRAGYVRPRARAGENTRLACRLRSARAHRLFEQLKRRKSLREALLLRCYGELASVHPLVQEEGDLILATHHYLRFCCVALTGKTRALPAEQLVNETNIAAPRMRNAFSRSRTARFSDGLRQVVSVSEQVPQPLGQLCSNAARTNEHENQAIFDECCVRYSDSSGRL